MANQCTQTHLIRGWNDFVKELSLAKKPFVIVNGIPVIAPTIDEVIEKVREMI